MPHSVTSELGLYCLHLSPKQVSTLEGINLLYTGRLFHCYKLDEFICHFRGVRSVL